MTLYKDSLNRCRGRVPFLRPREIQTPVEIRMSIALENQRTYALVGTGGSGKTSLAEMLLFQAGIINRLGAIEEGTTALDYEPEEIKRRGSIQPGFASFDWKGCRHNLIDIPGDSNFSGDMEWLWNETLSRVSAQKK